MKPCPRRVSFKYFIIINTEGGSARSGQRLYGLAIALECGHMGPMAKAIATKSSSYRHEIHYLDESIMSAAVLICLPASAHYLTFTNAVSRRQNIESLYKNILGDNTQIISVDLVLIVAQYTVPL